MNCFSPPLPMPCCILWGCIKLLPSSLLRTPSPIPLEAFTSSPCPLIPYPTTVLHTLQSPAFKNPTPSSQVSSSTPPAALHCCFLPLFPQGRLSQDTLLHPPLMGLGASFSFSRSAFEKRCFPKVLGWISSSLHFKNVNVSVWNGVEDFLYDVNLSHMRTGLIIR